MEITDSSDAVPTMESITDVAVAVDQSFAATSLLLPPLPANLQEHDRPHIMTRSVEPSLVDPLFIHMFHDESLDEYATRVFDYISTLLRGGGRLQGINYCINYRMIATLNYALTELVDDPAVLDVPNQLSPLYTAIHTANVPAVTLLLGKGVATNVPRFTYDRQWSPIRDDWSPLMLASYNDFDGSKIARRNEIAMLLIRHGCDINHQSEKSATASIYRNALTISAYQHNWPLVSYLLEHCDDEIKEGALEIYRKYPNAMRSRLSTERLVNWNEIRYGRTIWRICEGYDALYEDASLKKELSRKVIEFLGYGIQEMVSVWE
jgi:hypothetical protein